MKKHVFAWVVLVVLLGGSLFASGSGEPAATTKTLRFSTWAPEKQREVYTYVAEIFEEEVPGAELVMEYVDYNNYYKKLNSQYASGNAPDVIQNNDFYTYYINDGLMEISTYLKKDGINPYDTLIKGITEICEIPLGSGKLYALPVDFYQYWIYANVDMFKQAGVPVPKEWTWDEFRAACKKLVDSGAAEFAYAPSGFPQTYAGTYETDYLTDDWKKSQFGSKAYLDAMKFITTTIFEDKSCAAPKDVDDTYQAFSNGKILAMYTTGTWGFQPMMKITDFDWDVLPMPKGRVESNYGTADYVTINTSSKQGDLAWEFMKRLIFDERGTKKMAVYTSPPVKDISQWEDFITLYEGEAPNIRICIEQALRGYTWGVSGWAPGQKDRTALFNSTLNDIYSGAVKYDEAMPKLAEQINQILDRFYAAEAKKK